MGRKIRDSISEILARGTRWIFTSTALSNDMKSRPHDEAMTELYRNDPALARAVIDSILEDAASLRKELEHTQHQLESSQTLPLKTHNP